MAAVQTAAATASAARTRHCPREGASRHRGGVARCRGVRAPGLVPDQCERPSQPGLPGPGRFGHRGSPPSRAAGCGARPRPRAIALAAKGFRAIQVFERWTMPVVLVVMAVMTVLVLTRTEFQPMAQHGEGHGGIVAMSQLMTAIGIGWGITWLIYASDYTRFVPNGVAPRKVITATMLGMFLPTVWLAGLGAALASGGGGTDPAQLVITAFGAMALPVLLLVLHGPIAANIVVMYSAGLAALSMDMRAARWKISVATGVIASAVLIWFLNAQNVAESFKQWLVSLVFWLSPWAGICLVDFFVLRRGRIAVDALYEPARTSRLGDFNKRGSFALAAGLIAAWAFQTGATPVLTGPLSRITGGLDLSWLTGILVGGGMYWLLARRTVAPSLPESTSGRGRPEPAAARGPGPGPNDEPEFGVVPEVPR
ncbi:purine-cytosine permease family protein [Streptomyces rapamycinicus]|nr:cytosine permease [Streptomyces rapamycinicus]UTP36973.1 cytosine permease [Streptomyces rapamycinicus NRRL 5491]